MLKLFQGLAVLWLVAGPMPAQQAPPSQSPNAGRGPQTSTNGIPVFRPPGIQLVERTSLPGGLVRERLRLPGFDPDESVPAIAIHPGAGGPFPLAICMHYFRGSKESLEPWCRDLAARGVFAITIDAYLHGERSIAGVFHGDNIASLGAEYSIWVHQSSIARTARDVPVILDALVRRPDIDGSRVGLTGMSMGASTAMVLACREPRVRVVASLVGAVDFWWDVTKLPPGPEQERRRASYSPRLRELVESIDPRPRFVEIPPKALCLINAGRDEYIDLESVRRFVAELEPLYAKDKERLRFVPFPEAGHGVTGPMWKEAQDWIVRGLAPSPPYPRSPVIESITWHWETLETGALGSDLWPVTWGPDDHLYAAWGDGGGFGGSNSDGRVPLGFARIEGGPKNWRGVNLNGGKDPEHPASFPSMGKTTGVAFVDGLLYATINLEDGTWPDVTHVLAWSVDKGATWVKADWLFPKGAGNFQPAKFLGFGRDYAGIPPSLAGYAYLYGPRQSAGQGGGNRLFLARAPKANMRERAAYEFFRQIDAAGKPIWVSDIAQAQPVFVDPNGVTPASVVHDPGLNRFLLTCFHVGPGQLGVFDAPAPWGPWTTVAYTEDWGRMGAEGEGLSCGFPQKWMSADGLDLWCVFSVYGEGAKQGVNAHDRFNLVKATLQPIHARNP